MLRFRLVSSAKILSPPLTAFAVQVGRSPNLRYAYRTRCRSP